MKYRLTFACNEPVSLPVQYNHIMQAVLLKWIGDSTLHDAAYEKEKRNYKLFTFSNLYGPYHYDSVHRRIIFEEYIQVYLSFYGIAEHPLILKNIREHRSIDLSGVILPLIDCSLVQETYGEDCVVKTLSPVTIHSTMQTMEGKQKTYYYSPLERDFSEMIRQNLLRKYEAYHGHLPENQEFSIEPVNKHCMKEVHIYYKSFSLKGWKGKFRLRGSAELIELALLAGIGARNSIGLGCILLDDKDK
ncbi:MAG: CRISPR-associated endoribonuclease Cas6 [Lachnospiraceae bacterium]